MTALTRLLGFVPLAGLDALQATLAAVPGPAVRVARGPAEFPDGGLAALAQAEPAAPLLGRGRKTLLADLRTVQRRLEIACQAGPFLPMDPAASCCPDDAVPAMLARAWDGLAAGLARHGGFHQWDIAVRWRPETVVRRARAGIAEAAAGGGAAGLAAAVAAALRAERDRRETAMIAALTPAIRAVAAAGAAGSESEVVITVLVEAARAAVLEAALEGLAPEDTADTVIDMRGPLPPLSFHPVRLATAEQGDISSAWHRLGLPARVTRDSLHQQWRARAATAHPDRQAAAEAPGFVGVSDLTEAYRLLRGLLPASGTAETGIGLRDLLDRAGPRLVLPDAPAPSRSRPALAEAVP